MHHNARVRLVIEVGRASQVVQGGWLVAAEIIQLARVGDKPNVHVVALRKGVCVGTKQIWPMAVVYLLDTCRCGKLAACRHARQGRKGKKEKEQRRAARHPCQDMIIPLIPDRNGA